jgi:hypothetical protein
VLAGPDSQRTVHGAHPDLTVADRSGIRTFRDGAHHGINELIRDDNIDPDLWHSATTAPQSASGERSPARRRPTSKPSSTSSRKRSTPASVRPPHTPSSNASATGSTLKLNPGTIASYRGQAGKWIYPKLGARKLKELKATEVERFLNDLGKVLSKRSLLMIKSTLRRSIRRA